MNSVATQTQAVNSSAAATKKVLVVDDDPGILTMTCAMLQASNYKTLVAASGEEGLEIYKKSKDGEGVDLVLLDLTLPGGMSGIETLDQMLQFDPAAQVIATSGYFEETATAAQAARQRGFQGILPKPYTAERLLRLVQVSMTKVAA